MVANDRLWKYKQENDEITEVAPIFQRQINALLPFKLNSEHIIVQTKSHDKMLSGFWKINFLTGETEKIVEEPRGHNLAFKGGATVRKIRSNLFFITSFREKS